LNHGCKVLHALQPVPETVESASESSEWSGVVELRHPLEHSAGTRELRALLAQSFALTSDDIRILHWARLH
jgi:hypothetical protein